jgi:hypothetical protein
VKDPLVVPAAALAAGILLSRAAGFQQSELAWAMAALGALALGRGSRWLASLYRGNEYDTGMMQAILVGQVIPQIPVTSPDIACKPDQSHFHAVDSDQIQKRECNP